MSALPYRFLAAFSLDEHLDSPTIEQGAPSLALAVTDIGLGERSAQFVVRITFGFNDNFYSAFKFIHRAIVLTIEEPDFARAAAVRMIDPERHYFRKLSPNFEGEPDHEPSLFFSGGWINVPLQVGVVPRGGHGGLFVQASLQRHRSARIRVPLDPPAKV